MSDSIKVVHPGELLLNRITALGMKQKELAIRAGVSEKHISTIINGTKEITSSFARKLDIALGDDSGTWAKHQAAYDDYMAKLEEENGITEEEVSILKSLKEVVDYFLEVGVMHNHCGNTEKIIQLRKVLCVNNLSVIPQITYNAAYRAQIRSSTNINPYVLFAWQRMCELATEDTSVIHPFDREQLMSKISEIKKLMFEQNPNIMIVKLKEIFCDCGVAFTVVHHFRGAPVQGFIKQTEKGRVILCVTIRGKSADRFWFSLFHEIGHLINGDTNARFVDFDTVKSEMEEKADIFARDTLIAPDYYRDFVQSEKYHSLPEIKAFSLIVGVPHWIIIGRLHNDGWLDWSFFAHETPSYVWKKEKE